MNEKAFGQMAERLRGRIVMQIKGFCRCAEDAEDVVQDVMLRLWQMRDELDDVRSIDALAFTMARRMVINGLRRKPMDSMDAGIFTAVCQANDPSMLLEDKENDEWLSARIARLPSTWHTILYMRQVECRSSKEIATLLGLQEASVRTLLSRARKCLFEDMQKRK